LALDEPQAEDTVKIINEVKVAIDSSVLFNVEEMTLEYNPDRKGLVLTGNESDCC
jgi:Fe-S cluster assembly iron-binding protein IscA